MSWVMALVMIPAGALPSLGQLTAPEPVACGPTNLSAVPAPAALTRSVNPASSYGMTGIWATIPPDGRVELNRNVVVADEVSQVPTFPNVYHLTNDRFLAHCVRHFSSPSERTSKKVSYPRMRGTKGLGEADPGHRRNEVETESDLSLSIPFAVKLLKVRLHESVPFLSNLACSLHSL